MNKIVIIGAGQQGRNCLRLAKLQEIDVIAFVDEYVEGKVEGIDVYSNIEEIEDYNKYKYIVGIGDLNVRKKYIAEIKEKKLESINLIDTKAIIEDGAEIGTGNYIYSSAIVYSSAKIGNHNIVNAKALLATDSQIGENCDIKFGSNVCGDCHIGDNSVIGYNSTIASGNNVGKNVIVEANTVIYRNVKDGEIVSGIVR